MVISTVFGRHADHRLVEALSATGAGFFDYTRDDDGKTVRDHIWIDYVADLGDGWDSTYAVASSLALPSLELRDSGGVSHRTERGRILLFGGDLAYPVADRERYEQRLLAPYAVALRYSDRPNPDAFAIPGNHDWYDSLVTFSRFFCQKRWFAGWRTRQDRSYFALKLPHGWWLVGTDVQLGSDIDFPQLQYFRQVAREMGEGDRIILCNAEPHWIYEKLYGEDDPNYSENNLKYLEEKVFGRSVTVFIAGDLHHYRRHEASGGRQKITAGGGGAFLHPTHGQDLSMLRDGFVLRTSYPEPAVSRRLCWRNLLFLGYNPTFGVVTGVLYLLSSWAVMADVGQIGIRRVQQALHLVVHNSIASPVAAFWVLALLLGFWLFTDTHSKRYRLLMGPVHGLFHVLAAFFIGWGATYVGVSCLKLSFLSIRQLLLAAGLIFPAGWIAGSFIMGIYLLVSLNGFSRHQNEAFSSLSLPDWKNFLRLRISRDGTLTIFPIGIQRVPRRWKERPPASTGPELVGADRRATPPELIESPIELR